VTTSAGFRRGHASLNKRKGGGVNAPSESRPPVTGLHKKTLRVKGGGGLSEKA